MPGFPHCSGVRRAWRGRCLPVRYPGCPVPESSRRQTDGEVDDSREIVFFAVLRHAEHAFACGLLAILDVAGLSFEHRAFDEWLGVGFERRAAAGVEAVDGL